MTNNAFKGSPAILTDLLYVVIVSLCYATGVVSVETLHLKYILLFPLGILVAIIAMSSGIDVVKYKWTFLNRNIASSRS